MHNCKKVYKRLEAILKEMDEEVIPSMTELDKKHVLSIRELLKLCQSKADRWINDLNRHSRDYGTYHGMVVRRDFIRGRFSKKGFKHG